MSKFGDSAVAGMSVIGRVSPVAFAIVFAVSGAIGPIIGQNLGVGRLDRVKEALSKSFWFICLIVIVVSIILFSFKGLLITIFQLKRDAINLIYAFTLFVSISYIFVGAGFVANAAFNNLGRSSYPLVINILKATILRMPFVYIGAKYYGAVGVLMGRAIGALIIGLIAYLYAYVYI